MSPQPRKTILLADDGSEHAQSAVAMLRVIPFPPKSRVHVLRVFPIKLIY